MAKISKRYKKLILRDKEEWLKAKEQTIGGSEASAIVNKSKWLTPNDLYNKMVLGKNKTISSNSRMIQGTLAESKIRDLFALEHSEFEVVNPPKYNYWLFVRKDKPYLSCTPDGLLKSKSGLWGLEIKDIELRKREDANNWESGTLPDQYLYQILHYLVVLNDLEGVILNARLKYFTHDDVNDSWVLDKIVEKPYYLYRSDFVKSVETLERKETNFYEENIVKRKRPVTLIKF